jgi:hypothetical protein
MTTASNNIANPLAFVRTTREFPRDINELAREMNRGWIEIAGAVNNRTIAVYPTNKQAQTGESWFLENNVRQRTLRQVYTFTTNAAINHGITVVDPNQFSRCWGSYTDGTNSYGITWANTNTIAGLPTFYITSTQIIMLQVTPITAGRITLEWLSQAPEP